MVMTSLMISPLRCSPPPAKAADTMCDSSGLEATTTFAPGTSFGIRRRVQMKKNSWRYFFCASVNVVNRGSGDRA